MDILSHITGNFMTVIMRCIARYFKKQENRYNSKLKNGEGIFSLRLKAANDLYIINQIIISSPLHAEEDWYDACTHIVLSFSTHEKKLQEFLGNHQACLSNPALIMVEQAINICISGRLLHDDEMTYDVSTAEIDKAEELCAILKNAITLLRKESNSNIYT